LFGANGLLFLWAQAAGTTTSANSLVLLALRRWYSTLTLSSSEAVPSLFALWAWLVGIAGLVIVAVVLQGGGPTLRQLFDFAGHARLLSEAMGRLRRSGRVVAIVIGFTVVAWTMGQIRTYSQGAEQGRDDLVRLVKSRSLVELGVEQGIMAALTPLRDVAGLGDNMPLVLAAIFVLFRATATRASNPYLPRRLRPKTSAPQEAAALGIFGFYLLYRLLTLSPQVGDLPLGVSMPVGGSISRVVEGILVPSMMVLCDGLLMAWILVELRNASLGERGNDRLETDRVLELWPGAVLACALTLPARYVATTAMLVLSAVPANVSGGGLVLARYLRWQLNWGLADLQGLALVALGMAGAVAWTRGSPWTGLRGYRRLFAREGGRLVAAVLLAGAASAVLSALVYVLVLALPPQHWVLAAADGYAHYATLPVGLVLLAATVELAERSLPEAVLVSDQSAASPVPSNAPEAATFPA
jgi:hypothetical protein